MPPPSQPQPRLDDLQRELYGDGLYVENEYEVVSGLCELPIAEAPPTDPAKLKTWSPVTTVQLHAPYRRRTVRGSARKQTNPPIIPSPQSSGRFTFLGGSIWLPIPGVDSDGNGFVWNASYEYVFVEKIDPSRTSGYVLGNPPFRTEPELKYENTIGGGAGDGVETAPGPVRGASLAQSIDLTQPDWGQSLTLGAYTEPSYYPAICFDATAISGGDLPPPP